MELNERELKDWEVRLVKEGRVVRVFHTANYRVEGALHQGALLAQKNVDVFGEYILLAKSLNGGEYTGKASCTVRRRKESKNRQQYGKRKKDNKTQRR